MFFLKFFFFFLKFPQFLFWLLKREFFSVLDVNDNAPKFEQTSYSGSLTEDAVRGQFVTVITASDPDVVDQDHLTYNVIGGNQLQNFALDSSTGWCDNSYYEVLNFLGINETIFSLGMITLNNLQKLTDSTFHLLNVSVSDGVFTSFARVRIEILSTNLHAPVFDKIQYEARVSENQAPGVRVMQVRATDKDQGVYGQISYSFVSQFMMERFHINNMTGMLSGRGRVLVGVLFNLAYFLQVKL